MNLLYPVTRCLILATLILPLWLRSEGVRELRPDSTISSADLFIENGAFGIGAYAPFAVTGCAPNYRLNIHIKQAGEKILFGMKSPTARTFNLRKPDGTIVLTGTCPTNQYQPGYIRYYHQAVVGPFPASGGYIPLEYTVTSAADTGNYYFEISLSSSQYLQMDLWDFQVISGAHSPPVPADMINGRVWSSAWQINAELGYNRVFNGSVYVYSDDGIVTNLTFSNARIGAATIFCNPYGCLNTGDFLTDRQSKNSNTFMSFPAIAGYKVFLNDPDTTLYPSGVYGEITGSPDMIPDPAFPPCSNEKQIRVDVTTAGNVDITITFPGNPLVPVNLFSQVEPGVNEIPWNGLDGGGNPIPDGTPVSVSIHFVNGLTNLPIWDQERNPNGFIVSLVRPVHPTTQTPQTFWDDSQLNPTGYYCPVSPQSVNLTGCTPGSIPGYPGCHPWGDNNVDCHDKMINTWWYGSSSNATFSALFFSTPANPTGHDNFRCGPGSVLLSVSVAAYSTADWYAEPAGGVPLLTGDTLFPTPVIYTTTTFYAEARNDTTSCTSQQRVPVIAEVLPAPEPTIAGEDTVCTGSAGVVYQTEPGNLNYEWWLSSGGIITSPPGTSQISVTWTEAGYHAVFVNYTNPNGCQGAEPAAFRVTVIPLPDTAGPITGETPVCAGASLLVYRIDTVRFAQTYHWDLPPGFILISGAATPVITVSLSPDAVSGNITVYASNLCGDSPVSQPFPVTIVQPPAAVAGQGDTLCEDSPFTVTGATASGYTSLSWTTDGQGSLTGQTTLQPTYHPASGETGLVTMTLTAANPPCESVSSSLQLLYQPAASADAGSDLLSCGTQPVSPTGSTASHYTAIFWSTSGDGLFSDPEMLHPVYYPGLNDLQAGSVTLTLSVTPIPPCQNTRDSLLLTLSHPPQADAGQDASRCNPADYVLSGASAAAHSSLNWAHTGKGILLDANTIQPTYLPASGEKGAIAFTLTASGTGGCSDTAVTSTASLLINRLAADAGTSQTIDSGMSTTLTGWVTEGSGDYGYLWEPSSRLVNPALQDPGTVPLTETTRFTLMATDRQTGCTASDSVTVLVKGQPTPPPPPPECLEVYNVITPNGDGLNDTWIITCIDQYPGNQVTIMNRWGDVIVRLNGYNNTTVVWDGTNRHGEVLPDGTYYYSITIPGYEPLTGWVFLK